MPANSLEKIGNQSKDFPRCLSSPLRAVAANGESRPGPAHVGKHLPGKENKEDAGPFRNRLTSASIGVKGVGKILVGGTILPIFFQESVAPHNRRRSPLYGFEAISHHNGWVAAATGACIVFAGLSTLAFLISQLHKLLNLLDRPPKVTVTVAPPEPPAAARPEDPLDLERTVERYLPLIEELDAEFVLADLYVLARKYHLPHVHLSIRTLVETGRLEPLGEGVFRFTA